jgi:hypothetical protein
MDHIALGSGIYMRFRKYLFALLALICLILTLLFIITIGQAKSNYEAENGIMDQHNIPAEFIMVYSCTVLPGGLMTLAFAFLAYFDHREQQKSQEQESLTSKHTTRPKIKKRL